MEKSLFSTITLLIFSVTLTACSSGSTGGSTGGGGGGTPFEAGETFTINIGDPIIATNPQAADTGTYKSLSDISTGAVTDSAEKSATLQGLAVFLNDSAVYKRETTDTAWNELTTEENLNINRNITLSRITAPAVTLTFGADGSISGVTAAYDDADYTGASADRSTVFGFDSDYMAYVSWGTNQTITDLDDTATTGNLINLDGIMIAGIQTADTSIPTEYIADFVGKGSGVYGTKAGSYDTEFDITGNVNFSARSLSLATSNTACTNNCSDVTVPSYLNFSAANLSFANADNNAPINKISIALTFDSTLTGTLDARFYGTEAQEFGGTFALAEATTQTSNGRYYYGAFGAELGEAFEFMGGVTTTDINAHETKVATSANTNIGTHISLSAISDDDVTLQGLAVLVDDVSIYTRKTTDTPWTDTANLNIGRTISTSRLISSAVSLAFTGGDASVTTIYADKTHTSSTATFNVDNSDIFGFDSDYMTYISWNLDKTDLNGGIREEIYSIDGAMIAGIETNVNDLPETGHAVFEGKGKGVYGFWDSDKLTRYNTSFTTKATVDFKARNMVFNTVTEACTDCNNFDVSKLDFTGLSLSFADDNNITKNITLNSTLIGVLDARFYGGEAQEFGGTFALAEPDMRYYYGAFGTKRGDVTSFSNTKITVFNLLDSPIMAENPQATSIAYASLTAISAGAVTDGAEKSATLQALAVFLNDTTDYERQNAVVAWTDTDALKIDRQITVASLSSPAVMLTFGIDGAISAVTAHADADDTDATADRSTIFGFDSDYMAAISWGSAKAFDESDGALTQTVTNIDGMMIAGIETEVANIPTIANFGFEGKGQGIYGIADNEYKTVFDMIAIVNITDRNITLTASKTICPDFDCGINANHLDFSGTLSYKDADNNDAAINHANGTVNGGNALTGTADARFYGDKAQEFGGTFLLANISSYYYGAFGAQTAQYNGDELKTYAVSKPVARLTLDEMAWNRNDPNNPMQVTVPDFEIPTDKNNNAYTSIEALRSDTTLTNNSVKSFTLPVLGPNRYYRWDYQRDDTSIAWSNSNIDKTGNIVTNTDSVVTINYHVKDDNGTNRVYYQGGAGTEGIVLYRKTFDVDGNEITNRYAANTGADKRTFFKGAIIGLDSNVTNLMHLYKGNESGHGWIDFVGFKPDNIVVFRWYMSEDKGLLGEDNLEAKTDTNFGQAIAGLETGKNFGSSAFGAIPTSGNATFAGKGTGSYGYELPQYNGSTLSKREQIDFNMAANVDFDSRNINLSAYNSCYTTTCTIKRKGLNFNVNLGFDNSGDNVNNMSAPITTSNGLLEGTLDARFYGNVAQEFGGSFALIGTGENKIYYYGIFAGNQTFDGTTDSFSVNIIPDRKGFEQHYNYPEATNIPYASFAKATGANDASQFVLRGSAVQKHDVTNYVRNATTSDWDSATDADLSKVRDINVAGSKTPALALDFDETGNIAAIEAIFGFNSYKATELAGGATDISANGTISNADYADAQTSHINADREAFGFKSDYMVYVSWDFTKNSREATNIADDIYDIGGMMVAGLETQNIPTSGNIINFIGAGKGNYGDKDADHAVSFKTIAEVNFGNRTVAFEASQTACVVGACTLDADTLNTLNFTRALKYSAGVNSAGQTIRVASSLVGPLYARFYGVGDDSAREFGGTFAVRDSTRYYYGAFGADKKGLRNASLASEVNVITITPTQPIAIATKADGTTPYASFRESILDSDNNTDRIFTLHGGAVYGGHNTNYSRTAGQNWHATDVITEFSVTNLSDASASITVNGDEKISDLTIGLDEKSYAVAAGATPNSAEFKQIIDGGDDGATGELLVSRHDNVFDFWPNNMLYVNWDLSKETLSDDNDVLSDKTHTTRGMMIVGIESEISAIPNKNYPFLDSYGEFIGKGRGYYNSALGVSSTTLFVMTVNVDFTNQMVSLASSNTRLCNSLEFTSCSSNSMFDFSTGETPISYKDGDGVISNNISGNIASADDNFEGKIDAHFYGASANEIGGTFAMIADDNGHYYGAFGAELKNDNSFEDPFNRAYDGDDTGAVTRVNKKNWSRSPNDNGKQYDSKTYVKYDSFLKAQSEIKGGQNRYVHTVGLAAIREDTVRYQRYIGKDWTDASTDKETITVVANLNNATSYIKYYGALPEQGRVQDFRIFSYKRTNSVGVRGAQLGTGHGEFYRLYDANDTEEKRTKHNLDLDAGDYHYITASDPIKHSFGKLHSSNIAGNLTLMRPNEFGFQAKYMAYIRWTLTRDVEDFGQTAGHSEGFDVDGYMVSGFQTEHNTSINDGGVEGSADDLPITGNATFKGKGMGTYHAAMGQGYRTSFNANAEVDFAAGTVGLTLNGTSCVAGLDSNTCNDAAIITALGNDGLDIDATNTNQLTFTQGENNITGVAAETKGGMNGQIDARFYGQNRTGANKQNAAKEFGGAFSFRDGDKSYIGIFGTSCEATGGVCP